MKKKNNFKQNNKLPWKCIHCDFVNEISPIECVMCDGIRQNEASSSSSHPQRPRSACDRIRRNDATDSSSRRQRPRSACGDRTRSGTISERPTPRMRPKSACSRRPNHDKRIAELTQSTARLARASSSTEYQQDSTVSQCSQRPTARTIIRPRSALARTNTEDSCLSTARIIRPRSALARKPPVPKMARCSSSRLLR